MQAAFTWIYDQLGVNWRERIGAKMNAGKIVPFFGCLNSVSALSY